jgi:hypothetical protein
MEYTKGLKNKKRQKRQEKQEKKHPQGPNHNRKPKAAQQKPKNLL